MEYNFLLEQNKEYQDLYKEYHEILDKKRKELTKINNETIEYMDLEKLDYLQLKELLDLISYNIDGEIKTKINNIYLSKKPYTNKVVEKMDFLTKDKKIQLDLSLSNFKNKYMTYGFWSNIKVNKETENKIIEILLKEEYLRTDYQLLCKNCRDYITLLNEKKLDEIKEHDNIIKKIKKYEREYENKKPTAEEESQMNELYDRYYEDEFDNPLIHFCDRCNYENEFENLEEILKYSKEIYYIK